MKSFCLVTLEEALKHQLYFNVSISIDVSFTLTFSDPARHSTLMISHAILLHSLILLLNQEIETCEALHGSR